MYISWVTGDYVFSVTAPASPPPITVASKVGARQCCTPEAQHIQTSPSKGSCVNSPLTATF